MTIPVVKLCKDCMHISADLVNCFHPYNVDLVTGTPVHIDAHDMRFQEKCGFEAKLFEPRSAHVLSP
jgi:hypothetical protein